MRRRPFWRSRRTLGLAKRPGRDRLALRGLAFASPESQPGGSRRGRDPVPLGPPRPSPSRTRRGTFERPGAAKRAGTAANLRAPGEGLRLGDLQHAPAGQRMAPPPGHPRPPLAAPGPPPRPSAASPDAPIRPGLPARPAVRDEPADRLRGSTGHPGTDQARRGGGWFRGEAPSVRGGPAGGRPPPDQEPRTSPVRPRRPRGTPGAWEIRVSG